MGRNTVPEVKPPAPSSGAGDVPEGNQSPSYRPSPSAFLAGAPSPQPSLLREAGGGPDVPAATPPSGLSGAWPAEKCEGVEEVELEEESEGVKGRGLGGRNGRPCVLTSRRPYILDSAAISAFRSCEAKLSRYASYCVRYAFRPCRNEAP